MDSIPPVVNKMIQDIKEISRIHTEEEIYAMLQECSMDPNEAVQKLLSQDTFHEVKRKRDRKKEIVNRESSDLKWKQGTQRREIRGGRGTYSSRYTSHDAGISRNFNAGRESGNGQSIEKSISLAPCGTDVIENNEVLQSSSVPADTNGPSTSSLVSSSLESEPHMLNGGGFPSGEECSLPEAVSKKLVPPATDNRNYSDTVFDLCVPADQASHQFASPGTGMQPSVSSAYVSTTDPIIVTSLETRPPAVVGAVKCDILGERISMEPSAVISVSNVAASSKVSSCEVAASEMSSTSMQGMLITESQIIDENNSPNESQISSVGSQVGVRVDRASTNYSSKAHQIIGLHKAGSNKEWKPKLSQVFSYSSGTMEASVVPHTVGNDTSSQSSVEVSNTDEAASILQKKMEDLHFSDDKHVIIPNHLQVSESERTGLSFGSFEVNFNLGAMFINGSTDQSDSLALTDSSHVPEENTHEHLSIHDASNAKEQDVSDNPQSLKQMLQNLSSEGPDIPSVSATSEYDRSSQEVAVAQEGPQFSVVHTAPAYSTFGVVPPMLGNQFTTFENSDPQAHDTAAVPSFVVQQPFDPSAGFYSQIYPPSVDSNGHYPPFLVPDTGVKYNGSLAMLPPQAGLTSSESTNSTMLSTTGSAPLATEAVGVMQAPVPVTQQSSPVFRQPAGVHVSHYPPNYIPYQYFSPFYVPTPTIQPFLSNPTFLQQPLAGSLYPPAVTATTTVKNALSQYKTGTNSSNSNYSSMPAGYGLYGSMPNGYNPNSAVGSGNLTDNEDITVPQKDAYITGQQTEGSAIWVPSSGRDIATMQASSLYNLPQGQHMAFAPLQASPGIFNGLFHPSQPVAASTVNPLLQPSQSIAGALEMVGRPSGVYQQPQRAQLNWTSNY